MNNPTQRSDEEIKAECIARDEAGRGLVYFISLDRLTYKLIVTSMYWSHLNAGERYCMVKNNNIYDTKEGAQNARDVLLAICHSKNQYRK